METYIYQKITKGRGRPRKVLEVTSTPISHKKPIVSKDLLEVLLTKKLITHDMHRACIIYRTFYFQFCRLTFAPRLIQNTYGETRGNHRRSSPYSFAGADFERDQLLEERYLKLRQRITEHSTHGARLFHHWLLFTNEEPTLNPNPQDLKTFKQICRILLKAFDA